MSEVNNAESVHVPALFFSAGRLPHDQQMVMKNYYQQTAEAESYRQELNTQRGVRGASTCARSLYISLFFDGAKNNEPYDRRKAEPSHPTNTTNIAYLHHASLDLLENGAAKSSERKTLDAVVFRTKLKHK